MFCDSVYQATAAPFDWTRASNTQSKIHYKPISARRRSDKTIYPTCAPSPLRRLRYAYTCPDKRFYLTRPRAVLCLQVPPTDPEPT